MVAGDGISKQTLLLAVGVGAVAIAGVVLLTGRSGNATAAFETETGIDPDPAREVAAFSDNRSGNESAYRGDERDRCLDALGLNERRLLVTRRGRHAPAKREK